jgi:hypothetical protein
MVIPWAEVIWQFFCQSLLRKEEIYILAGDECVDSKAGMTQRQQEQGQDNHGPHA